MSSTENAPQEEQDETVKGQEIMPFDDGSLVADKAQSSAMNLVINYADPQVAAGAAVFGLGLVVLPLLARLNELENKPFSYQQHGETNPNQNVRVFTESELRSRLGLLDPDFIREDLVRSTDDLDDYMNSCSMDTLDAEVTKLQKWRESANANLKGLQKRSALAFLGLPPDASDNDVSKMYKKMALELHPDKGGDPEKFQELQEMRERLTEIEAEENKTEEEKAEEEEAKQKEEAEEKAKMAPDERIKKLRMDVHDNSLRLWGRAKKSKEEISSDKGGKSNSQPALNLLRAFVERFVNLEVKTLRHGDSKGAEAKFRKFLRQGAEIVAVAALHDVQSTLQTLSMQFNYRLVARSGSPQMKDKCQALLQAVAEVPAQSEAFLKRLEDDLSDGAEKEKKEKEERARQQKEREARGDYSGEASQKAAKHQETAGQQQQQQQQGAKGQAQAAPGAAPTSDPFDDFDFEPPKRPTPTAAPTAQKPTAARTTAVQPQPQATVAKIIDEKKDITVAAPCRTAWDPDFDHPYAGALKGNGRGIYCRPCQRWIDTYNYDISTYLTHVERVHPKPPPGW
mmetsp:Transcript_69867/g.152433  ORF Transcript_69867/g.152433 Transcript_69867/m.152433 type:complete len:569 (+) Transcript_69867:131-1837(+)